MVDARFLDGVGKSIQVRFFFNEQASAFGRPVVEGRVLWYGLRMPLRWNRRPISIRWSLFQESLAPGRADFGESARLQRCRSDQSGPSDSRFAF